MGKLVLGIIIVIAVIVIGRRFYTHLHNNAQEQTHLSVLVIDKHVREFMGQTHKQQTEMPPPRVNYYATFRPLNSHNERVFQISRLLYKQLTLEQKGVLVFQGTRFIDFKAHP
ncbi:MAG: DUF2500 family protein [Oceanisphaera sp.]